MTGERWAEVGIALVGGFPAKKWQREEVGAYVAILQARGIAARQALDAIGAQTGQFPPSAGALAAMVERQVQGPPPAFTEAAAIVGRHITKLAYHDPVASFGRFVEAVAGEHEAVARWALAMGPRAVREMPDPAMPQERDASFRLSSVEREYGVARSSWEEDPRPGLASGEAQRVAGGGVRRHGLRAGGMVAAIEAGAEEGGGDGE